MDASERRQGRKDQGIGRDITRKEDARFLTGRGQYTTDLEIPGQVFAAMVRSPHAHARIKGIDAKHALAMPGVLAVLTGADIQADALGAIPHTQITPGTEVKSPHFLLPRDKARFVGEAVAMVIAQTAAVAKDGADAVQVDYEPLPSITHTPSAAGEKKAVVWDELGRNVYVELEVGDAKATDAAFKNAKHVVAMNTWVNRVTGVFMEPRGALGRYDAVNGRYEVFCGSGGVARFAQEMAEVFKVPLNKVRVVTPDVGGNFGTRNPFYPEYALVAWGARRVGRPVKWICDRSDDFLTDCHARDLDVHAEAAFDAEGRLLAMRSTNVSNVGAHFYNFVGLGNGVQLVTSLYRVPVAHVKGVGVATNTASTSSYRSAGRPEVMFVMERLMDVAALQLGIDRVELRRRNLLRPDELPYRTPLGKTFDSGEYESAMDKAMAMGDWQGFAARREESRRRGKLRGLGLSNYIEATGGSPKEWTRVTVSPEGRIDVAIGTQSSGQSHETSYAQLVNEWLGVPVDEVRILEGDTDVLSMGGGSQSGRSMRFASIIVKRSCEEIEAKGRKIAAVLLEAAAADIDYGDGHFQVKGTDRRLSLYEVARAAATRSDLPAELRGPLEASADQTLNVGSFPYGCHVCEMEVDPDTGAYEILRYSAVDDVGRAVSPKIVDGQTHGGIVQGLGQALYENCHYDPETGQMLAGSFMDYAIPRAADVPSFNTFISEVPATNHPLGIRAGSESGTPPALCVVVSAIVDALSGYGVKHIELPLTPQKVWRAMRGA
jgi:aerobic carbon-monoxide dehydrogenase large subunit